MTAFGLAVAGCEYQLHKAPRVDIKVVQREWEQVLNASAPEPGDSDCEMIEGPEPNFLHLGLDHAVGQREL